MQLCGQPLATLRAPSRNFAGKPPQLCGQPSSTLRARPLQLCGQAPTTLRATPTTFAGSSRRSLSGFIWHGGSRQARTARIQVTSVGLNVGPTASSAPRAQRGGGPAAAWNQILRAGRKHLSLVGWGIARLGRMRGYLVPPIPLRGDGDAALGRSIPPSAAGNANSCSGGTLRCCLARSRGPAVKKSPAALNKCSAVLPRVMSPVVRYRLEAGGNNYGCLLHFLAAAADRGKLPTAGVLIARSACLCPQCLRAFLAQNAKTPGARRETPSDQ